MSLRIMQRSKAVRVTERDGSRAMRLLVRVEAALRLLAGTIVLALILLVLADVAARALGTGLAGAGEAAIWLHVALVGLASPLALRGPLAMRLDVLAARLPARLARVCAVAADGISLAAVAVLSVGAAEAAGAVGGLSPSLGLPEGLRFAVVSAGAGLTLLCLALARLGAGGARGLLASLAFAALLVAATRLDLAGTDLPASLVAAGLAALAIGLGAPLPHAFLFGAAGAIPFGGLLPDAALAASAVAGLSKVLLLAVPFFLLTGTLLAMSGAAERLVRLSASLVGHRRAGLAQTTLLTSLLFSGASGSSIANAAFGAKTFAPALMRRGHPPAEAGALVAATSVLDNVVPPSVAFLILAAATNLSVGGLLLGGFVAGPLMAAALAVAIHRKGGRVETGMARADGTERRTALLGALPALGLGVVVVLFIRAGLATTTEAAALAAAYAVLLGFQARMRGRDFGRALAAAGAESAAVGLLIASAAPFSYLLAVDGAGEALARLVTVLGEGPWAVLLLANLVLLAAGLVLDIGAAILLLAPILLPPVAASGIDPVQFGVILVVNLMIHGLLPPIGILVHVVAGVTGVPAGAIFRAVLPYAGALLVVLAGLSIGAVLLAR